MVHAVDFRNSALTHFFRGLLGQSFRSTLGDPRHRTSAADHPEPWDNNTTHTDHWDSSAMSVDEEDLPFSDASGVAPSTKVNFEKRYGSCSPTYQASPVRAATAASAAFEGVNPLSPTSTSETETSSFRHEPGPQCAGSMPVNAGLREETAAAGAQRGRSGSWLPTADRRDAVGREPYAPVYW